jgi:hypothetical protein
MAHDLLYRSWPEPGPVALCGDGQQSTESTPARQRCVAGGHRLRSSARLQRSTKSAQRWRAPGVAEDGCHGLPLERPPWPPSPWSVRSPAALDGSCSAAHRRPSSTARVTSTAADHEPPISASHRAALTLLLPSHQADLASEVRVEGQIGVDRGSSPQPHLRAAATAQEPGSLRYRDCEKKTCQQIDVPRP